jgi:hypothetical protein
MNRKVGIIGGTGPEGSGLAYRWARAGEEIVIGSRDAERAAETAAQLRGRIGSSAKIAGADNLTIAAECEVVVLTVPFVGCAALLKQLKSVWKPGTVVIDTTVPLAATVGGAATRMLGVSAWWRRFRIWGLNCFLRMTMSTATFLCAAMTRGPSRWPPSWLEKFRGRGPSTVENLKMRGSWNR